MTAEELTLNIAVNMGRVERWASEEKFSRIPSFLEETEEYLNELEKAHKESRFLQTFIQFKEKFQKLKATKPDQNWAEEALTWANILTHRAKLA